MSLRTLVSKGALRTSLRALSVSLPGTLLALHSGLACAHHSFASFDYSRIVDLDGTVKSFRWTNPHSYLEVLVSKDDGSAQSWLLETGTPNINARTGWRKDSVKPSDKVHVSFNPMKDGSNRGVLLNLTLPDGTVLQGEAQFSKPPGQTDAK
jgi:hypothetical protein